MFNIKPTDLVVDQTKIYDGFRSKSPSPNSLSPRNDKKKSDYLPINEPKKEAIAELVKRNAEEIALGNKKQAENFKILAVDDIGLNRMMIEKLLKSLGYAVETAVNGLEAVNKVSTKKYDLILMDCSMPIMDGYIATQEIRKMEKEQNRDPITILAYTSNDNETEETKCLTAGMNGYLCKPMKKEELQKVLEAWRNGIKFS